MQDVQLAEIVTAITGDLPAWEPPKRKATKKTDAVKQFESLMNRFGLSRDIPEDIKRRARWR
jgi:hypothetical protein